jgi:hypothetical protein
VAGARAVQSQVLALEPSDDVRVFTVWVNRGIEDEREAVDTTLLGDPRVTQYWDGEGVSGTHFGTRGLGGLGPIGFIFDVYYVFGPSATWTGDLPAPVAAVGGSVVEDPGRLLAEIRAQL